MNFFPNFLIFLLFFFLFSQVSKTYDTISVEEFGSHAGFYPIPRTKAAKMFYFFFESQINISDPVVIWLTGGPGCSSNIALFYENGPVRISKNYSLTRAEYSWNKVSNLIFVDQPLGTGFSTISDTSDIPHDENGISNDLYEFIQAFFRDHPKFVGNDFYITGESYAGHYIPAFASRIHNANKKKEGILINLKGFAIGNGLTNPEIQYGAYADYALNMKLISESDHESLKKDYTNCQVLIKRCNLNESLACDSAYDACMNIFLEIMSKNEGMNDYDLRKKCSGGDCYDFSRMETFLNQVNVRKALGVGDAEFFYNNDTVYNALQSDWMRNLEVKIPALVEDGIKVLIYAGEYDIICNWLGNARWVDQMNWTGHKDFVSAKTFPFLVDSKEAGLVKNFGPLTFIKVYNAGHMVPMDQPKVSLKMLQNWMHGKLKITAT